jgi:hypothetical protein
LEWKIRWQRIYWRKGRGVEHNARHITRLYMLRRLWRLRGSGLLGHSAALHSHANLHPHFASPGLCFAKPLSGLSKRHIQPERYMPCYLRFVEYNRIENLLERDWNYKNSMV